LAKPSGTTPMPPGFALKASAFIATAAGQAAAVASRQSLQKRHHCSSIQVGYYFNALKCYWRMNIDMEKIMILSNRQVENDPLLSFLKVLFPECQIEIRSSIAGRFENPFGKDNEKREKDERFPKKGGDDGGTLARY